MNTLAYFEIQAVDLARAKAFYETVFGWEFIQQEGLPIDYWQIKTDDIMGGLLPRPTDAVTPEKGTNAFTCSLHVEDYDAMAALIVKSGGGVALEKFAIPGRCWQGYFVDTEDNIFGIFQPDEKAA